MDEMGKDAQEKLQQLQMMEQSLQASFVQKQGFQAQQIEIESALSQLTDKKSAHKIIGSIMVETSVDDLKKELEEKKEKLHLRIKNLDKQEEKVKDKAESLQKAILEGMNKS